MLIHLVLVFKKMNSSYHGLARLAAIAKYPIGNDDSQALTAEDVDEVLACFSEIDTESLVLESNKIAYLEQMLRLQEPRHLSETQLSGRRFLLDMLRRLSLLPTGNQAQAEAIKDWDPSHPLKYLVYLLERTAASALAERVRVVKGIQDFLEMDLMSLGQWIDRHGIDVRELALIQPNFFAGEKAATAAQVQQPIHPQFAALAEESKSRNNDYVAEAFLSKAGPMNLVHKSTVQQMNVAEQGRGEALASIYDVPFDHLAATQTRLKAFFIPNRFGEPMIALSFVNAD